MMEAHLKAAQRGQSNTGDVGVGPSTDCLGEERMLRNLQATFFRQVEEGSQLQVLVLLEDRNDLPICWARAIQVSGAQ